MEGKQGEKGKSKLSSKMDNISVIFIEEFYQCLLEHREVSSSQPSPGDEIYVGVAGSFISKEEHQEWMDMARKVFAGEDIRYDSLTFSIGCHVGPGAFGMGISRKINKFTKG